MLKVCQRPELIQQLQHSLEFATDEQVNNDILLKYSLWDYLTPCDADNENILNACIARWRDEANQLYRTTLLQYDPLGNVNLHEDIADERRPDLTDTYSPEDTTTTAEAGYDVPRTMYDAVKTTRGGKDVTTRKGKENYERNKDLTGSDGRYTQQQLVEMQRKLVLDCLSWYVSKFAQCFNVSMSISDYECCEPVPDMCCELVPQVSPVDKKLNDIDNQLGVIQQSLTDYCTSMAEDIDELKKSVADSKGLLAAAISDKGVETASDATFAEMCDNIAAIPTGGEWVLVANWDFTQSRYDTLNNLDIYTVSGVTIDSRGIVSGGYSQRGFGLSNIYTGAGMRFDIMFSELGENYVVQLPSSEDVRIVTFYRSTLNTGYIYVPSYDSLKPHKPTLNVNGVDYIICDDYSDIVGHVLSIVFSTSDTYENAPHVAVYIDDELKCESDDMNGYIQYAPSTLAYLVVARTQNTTPFLNCYGATYICEGVNVYKLKG